MRAKSTTNDTRPRRNAQRGSGRGPAAAGRHTDHAMRGGGGDAGHSGDSPSAPRALLATRIGGSDVADASGEPRGEWLLIPYGQVRVERPLSGADFVFTPQHARSIVQWFEQLGRKLAIDYEHQSFDQLNTRPDGLRPAAGWISRLEVRDDGLWASEVAWTAKARELLRSGEYRYFSPVIYWTDEQQSDVAGLGPVALTNDPAMCGVAALAAGRVAPGGADAIEPVDEQPDADDFAAGLAAAEQRQNDPAAGEQRGDARTIALLERENELLRRKLHYQAADAFIERGMREGRIVDATSMDWRDDYLREPDAAEARLARSPVIRPPGRVIALDERGRPLTSPQVARRAGVAGPLSIDPQDYEAFERAFAAGRVRLFSGGAA